MSLAEQINATQREEEAARWAAKSAEPGYTGDLCVVCNRNRVFRRNDGRLQCEKCESFQRDATLAKLEINAFKRNNQRFMKWLRSFSK